MTNTSDAIGAPGEASARDVTFRRIIWRLIPFLTLVWFLAWIDRVNVGFAKLTMMDELGWSDAIYGAGAGIFFLGYFFFEVPSNLLLQRIGAPKTIMRIALGWGTTCLLMAFVTSPWQFYVLRFLMGAFEAGLQPGVILYLTYWLPSHRRGKALAFFMSASAMSLMVGSPIAAFIMTQFDGAAGHSGWQWLFIIEGIPSIIAGFAAYFILSDKPDSANWLSAAEKQHVREEMSVETASMAHREHNVWKSLSSPTMWALIMIFFCIVAANSTLVFYGPSLIKEAGVTDLSSLGWIMSGIYLCGWIGMVGNGWLSDRAQEVRWHTAIAASLGAAGLLISAFALSRGSLEGVMLGLAISAAGTMGAIPVFWKLPSFYMSGTAIVAGLAIINSIANLAGYFAPQLLGYLKQSTGHFATGLMLIAFVELCAAAIVLLCIRKGDLAR